MTPPSRLGRFLRIERSRAGAPAPEPDAATASRIGGVEGPAADPVPRAPARSGADLGRFAPPPPPPLELERMAPDALPFTRCPRCGMDHHLGVAECTGCGARLDSDACRAFNDALRRERLAQAAREAAAEAALTAARAEADAEGARDRRSAAELLAREVGEAERRRLDAELGGGELLRGARRVMGWLRGGRPR